MTQPDPAAQTDPNQPPAEQQPPAEPQATPPQQPAAQAPTAPQFTQADVDRMIGERLAQQQRQHAAELAAEQERAGKSELEKKDLDIARYQAERDEAIADAKRTVLDARLTASIADSEVRKDRREALAGLVRAALAKIDGLADKTDSEQAAAITAAVAEQIEAFPEWKANAAPPSGGGWTPPPTGAPTLEQFQAMTAAEQNELAQRDPNTYIALAKQAKAAAWG